MKRNVLFVLVCLVSLLAIAACAPTNGGTGAEPTTGAPATDATAAIVTEEVPGTGGDAATCVGVDTQQLVSAGQGLYAEQCASCHGEEGQGMGDFPALAASGAVTGEDVTALVQRYLEVDAHPKDLTPDQLAGVLTYVRGSFGNTAAAVCPEVVVPALPGQ